MSSLFVRGRLALLSALIGLLGLSAQNVCATSLQDLFATNGTITAGDKTFTSWKNLGDFSTNLVDLSRIFVTPLDDPPNNPGLRFTAVDGVLSTSGKDLIDLAFGYTVSTLDGIPKIRDNSLVIDDYSFGTENKGGFIFVFEDVFDGNDKMIGQKLVIADNRPPPVFDLSDSATFDPQSQLFIKTVINIGGDEPGDIVSLNSFTQRFSQVPEPGTFLLLTLGLVALRYGHRRFSANSSESKRS